MTTGAGALGAPLLGQAGWWTASVVGAAATVVVATQVRALGRLAKRLEGGRREAKEAIEKLIASEVNTHVDDAQGDGP